MEQSMNARTASSSALAYLGDCVLELFVRELLVSLGVRDSGALNDLSRRFVTAKAQSAALEHILPMLTEEETDFFHRGRNDSSHHAPKSASVAEYRRATGFETLFGALHMDGQRERAKELFFTAYGDVIAEIKKERGET